MKPLLISTYDNGGAAKSCLRLHQGLLDEGVQSKVLLRDKTNQNIRETYLIDNLENALKLKLTRKAIELLKQLNLFNSKEDIFKKNRSKGLEMYSYPDSYYDLKNTDFYEKSDLINLHWVANFIDYTSFFKNNEKPIFWTLHDQNPFTGGEHYKEMFLGMDENGFPIKREIKKNEYEEFKKVLEKKKEALKGADSLTIVTPSNWLAEEARKSELFSSYQTHVVPYGIDSIKFRPRNKEYSREILNIPKDKKVILFVADSILNERKGYRYLKKALEKVDSDDYVLCSVGANSGFINNNSQIIELGPIYDELLMSIIYSSADVFVIPSLMDNLPNTVLESLMCGTPVIGFPVGGIPDMIVHGENGFLTESLSVKGLVKSIEMFLSDSVKFKRDGIAFSARKKYDLNVQAKKYISIFDSI